MTPCCGKCPSGQTKSVRTAFTLVELLVVAAILGVVTATVAACLGGGIRAWDAARTFRAVEGDMLLGVGIIEKDLRNAVPFHGIPFRGDGIEMSFAGLVRGQGAAAGQMARLGTVKYMADSTGGAILRKSWPYPGDESDAGQPETVMDGLEGVQFLYFAPPVDGRASGAWQDRWTDVTNRPGAVRVMLSLSSQSGQGIGLQRTIVLPSETE